MQAMRLAWALLLLATALPGETIEIPAKRPGSGPLLKFTRNGKWGFMDRRGKPVIRPQFDAAHDFLNGLAAVTLAGKVGFIDETGKLRIPAEFSLAGDFSGRLAPVRVGRKWGFIDQKGRYAVEPQFQAAGEFHDGLARVLVWDRVACTRGEFTKEDAPEFAFQMEWPEADLQPCFPIGGKFGFINEQGAIVIAPTFFQAKNFSEGLAAVRLEEDRDSKWGFIDPSGAIAIAPQFFQADDFHEGLAAVEATARIVGNHVEDISWGFIDKLGQLKISAQFELLGSFSNGRAAAKRHLAGRWGFLDKSGSFVIPERYDSAWIFSEGLSAVFDDDGWRIIDTSGKWVLRQIRQYAIFSGGLAIIQRGTHLVYIDTRGREIADYN